MYFNHSNKNVLALSSKVIMAIIALGVASMFSGSAFAQNESEFPVLVDETPMSFETPAITDAAMGTPALGLMANPASKVSPAFSQQQYAVQKGTMLLSLYAGLKFGLKSMYYDDYAWGEALNVTAAFQPGVAFEYCVASSLFKNGMGAITVGGYLGYTMFHRIHIDARVALHVQLLEKLSVYAGVVLGAGIYTRPEAVATVDVDVDTKNGIPVIETKRVVSPSTKRTTSGAFEGDTFAGVRYSFTPMISISAEVSPGIYAMSLPVTQVACVFQF